MRSEAKSPRTGGQAASGGTNKKHSFFNAITISIIILVSLVLLYFINGLLAKSYANKVSNLITDSDKDIENSMSFANQMLDPSNPVSVSTNSNTYYQQQLIAKNEQVAIFEDYLKKAKKWSYALGTLTLRNEAINYFEKCLAYTKDNNDFSNYVLNLNQATSDIGDVLTEPYVDVNSKEVVTQAIGSYHGKIEAFVSYYSKQVENNFYVSESTKIKDVLVSSEENIAKFKKAVEEQNKNDFDVAKSNLENNKKSLESIAKDSAGTFAQKQETLASEYNQIKSIEASINTEKAKIYKFFIAFSKAKAWPGSVSAPTCTITRADLAYGLLQYDSISAQVKNNLYSAGPGFPVVICHPGSSDTSWETTYHKKGDSSLWTKVNPTEFKSAGSNLVYAQENALPNTEYEYINNYYRICDPKEPGCIGTGTIQTGSDSGTIQTGNVEISINNYLRINNRNFSIENGYDNISSEYTVGYLSEDFFMEGNSGLTKPDGEIIIRAGNDIRIGQGSVINVSGVNAGDPGAGEVSQCFKTQSGRTSYNGGGGGGSHAGNGGVKTEGGGGEMCDENWGTGTPATEPIPNPNPRLMGGRGGWGSYGIGPGYGGGIIKITSVNGSITNNGSMLANGSDMILPGGAGGAGGTIVLNASNDIINNNLIAANGGFGNWGSQSVATGTGGAGGAIAFIGNYVSSSSTQVQVNTNEIIRGNTKGWIWYSLRNDFSISAEPNLQSIVAGQATSYKVTAGVTDNREFQGDVRLSASISNGSGFTTNFPQTVNINNNSQSVTLTVNSPLNASPGDHIVNITGSHGNFGDSDRRIHTVQVHLNIISMQIIGDVWSGTGLGNIYIANGSVASAGGNVDVNGTSYKIANYSPTSLVSWPMIQAKMTQTIKRLSSENATSITQISVPFNPTGHVDWYLDTESSNPTVQSSGTNKYPEGKVWLVKNSGLNLSSTTFHGKGTIIVEGPLTIFGNLEYVNAESSLGLIASGNIAITSWDDGDSRILITKLQGAYYTPNNFRINAPATSEALKYNILAVANNIILNTRNATSALTIQYDFQTAGNPPPGFTDLLAPIYQEQNP